MGKWLSRHGFLITLAVVVTVGLAGWSPLVAAAEIGPLRNGIVVVVMFLMALPIEARSFGKALTRPAAPLTAIGINSIFLPLAAWSIAFLFSDKTGAGLIVVAIIPCTLASAAVWTRRAGGNDAIALVVTVVTNAACFLVVPLWLWLLLGRSDDPTRWLAMMPLLAGQVVAPMTVAQLLRFNSRIAVWSTERKRQLSLAAQIGILMMVALGAAKISQTSESGAVPAILQDGPLMVVAVIGLHLAAVGVGLAASQRLKLAAEDRIAVAISGSQKTLMVGLSLALDLDCSILPLITYHVAQLFIDTWIVDRWKRTHEPKPDDVPETPP